MTETEQSELLQWLDDQLTKEAALTESIDELNEELQKTLAQPGLQAPRIDALKKLDPLNQSVHDLMRETIRARETLLARVNQRFETESRSLRHIIALLPEPDRSRLDDQRRDVLEATKTAQAQLVHNQATCYYLFDFHRKYLEGIVQGQSDSQHYRADGQTREMSPGNIIGKAC